MALVTKTNQKKKKYSNTFRNILNIICSTYSNTYSEYFFTHLFEYVFRAPNKNILYKTVLNNRTKHIPDAPIFAANPLLVISETKEKNKGNVTFQSGLL